MARLLLILAFVFSFAVTFIATLSSTASPLAGSREPGFFEKMMARTLITGASVSDDWLAPSPGKKLAGRYRSSSIRKIAAAGQSGASVIHRITTEDFAKSSIIFAFDFFFWDSTRSSDDLGDTFAALERLVKMSQKSGAILVLGSVPSVLGMQQTEDIINKRIAAKCATYNRCRVFPVAQLYRQIDRDGGLRARGHFYSKDELLPDGIHVSSIASEIVADQVEGLLETVR